MHVCVCVCACVLCNKQHRISILKLEKFEDFDELVQLSEHDSTVSSTTWSWTLAG